MAKYETRLRGNFDELLGMLNHGILKGSISASYEDGSDYVNGHIRCAVRVYERHSMAKGSRVSMSVTLLGTGDELFVTIITAGGSSAMFFKINTLGEHTFLNKAIDIIEGYRRRTGF
ncbi:MAG: DUF6054 family protein [Defluviitaleaceae bacterium]|nr:DUF6054 family protein [Defluviitaleaceae bacterium]